MVIFHNYVSHYHRVIKGYPLRLVNDILMALENLLVAALKNLTSIVLPEEGH